MTGHTRRDPIGNAAAWDGIAGTKHAGEPTVDGLRLRNTMGRDLWTPAARYSQDGWRLLAYAGNGSVIVSTATRPADTHPWTHASISYTDHMPIYDDLVLLHAAVWGETGWAYQVFTPASDHINIHAHALHLWGRADGAQVLPDFGQFGTI
jgi:hypothetical protein